MKHKKQCFIITRCDAQERGQIVSIHETVKGATDRLEETRKGILKNNFMRNTEIQTSHHDLECWLQKIEIFRDGRCTQEFSISQWELKV